MASLSLAAGPAGPAGLQGLQLVHVKRGKRDLSRELRRQSDVGDLPWYVTADEIRVAAEGADPATAALLGFLWATGARVSEALAITPEDLDVDRSMARIPTLKRRRKDGSGRKTSVTRIVVIAGHWLNSVLGYVVQAQRGPVDRIWPIGRQHAWRTISAALKAAGVPHGRARPHAVRHGHAVHAVRAGVPLNIIQRQLGHASIVTTSIYLRVTGQDVAQAYDRCDW